MQVKIILHCIGTILLIYRGLFAEPGLSVVPVLDKKAYNPGDTIIVALQCKIPDKFHLYGNPLGPGIGKPLKILASRNNGIEWIGAGKTPATKYHPPMGEWVWAYKHEAIFFAIGKIPIDLVEPVNDTVIMESLLCENSCLPVTKEIPLLIPITNEKITGTSFADNLPLQRIFKIHKKMDIDWQ